MFALLVSGLPSAQAGPAQTPDAAADPRPIFRVDSELVVVDLVPTDRNQRFVDDLRPEEVRVTEDGEARPLQFLHLVRVGPADAARAGSPDGPTTPETARTPGSDPAAQETGALAVVIDLQGTPQQAMPSVLEAIRSMVRREVPEGTPLALATVWHGLVVRQPLTSDRAQFFAALAGVTSPTGAGSSLQKLGEEIDRTGMTAMEAIGVGRAVVLETSRELAEVSQSLAAFARSLAPLPGRKSVVVYSMGHALRPAQGVIALIQSRFPTLGQGAVSELAGLEAQDGVGEVRRLVDEANRSQVSFYTIDPMGLQVDLIDATHSGSVFWPATAPAGQGIRRRNVREPQEYLRTLAGDTGGRAFVNTNDLTTGLRRAWADAREYYLLGFPPSESSKKARGGFRRIEVKVARRGLDLRYRRGYWREDGQQRTDRDVVLAIRLPGLFADGNLAVEARVADGSLKVTSFLRQAALTFAERDGRQRCAISLQAFLRDAAGKLVEGRGLFAMDVALHMSPAEFEALRASGDVEIPASVPAPPSGTYQLLVVARHSGARLTTHTQQVVVP